MKNKNFGMIVDMMQDDENPFMQIKKQKPVKRLVKRLKVVEEYPENMKIEYVNVMPSGWL